MLFLEDPFGGRLWCERKKEEVSGQPADTASVEKDRRNPDAVVDLAAGGGGHGGQVDRVELHEHLVVAIAARLYSSFGSEEATFTAEIQKGTA